jgi:hypothetical protein
MLSSKPESVVYEVRASAEMAALLGGVNASGGCISKEVQWEGLTTLHKSQLHHSVRMVYDAPWLDFSSRLADLTMVTVTKVTLTT